VVRDQTDAAVREAEPDRGQDPDTGVTQEVDFRSPFNITTMITVVPITVDVHPVPGEMNTANNKASYDVRFSF